MPLIRVLLGVISIVAAGLLLSVAMQRLMRGLMLFFAGALAVGGLLVSNGVWAIVRRWRGRRESREERVVREEALAFD